MAMVFPVYIQEFSESARGKVVVSGYVLLRRRGPVAMRQELELSRVDVGGAERSDCHPVARVVLNHSM